MISIPGLPVFNCDTGAAGDASQVSEGDLDFGATLKGLWPGLERFGRYHLQCQIGHGEMGVVWLAQDSELDLEVALKFLPEELVHDETALDEQRQETRLCVQLSHQNIVHAYDLADGDRTAAIVMEWVEGKNLLALRLEKRGACSMRKSSSRGSCSWLPRCPMRTGKAVWRTGL